MPNIDVTYLPVTQEIREKLVESITAVFTQALSPDCSPDDVIIRFNDVLASRFAKGGKLLETFGRSSEEKGAEPLYPAAVFQMDIGWFAGKDPEITEGISRCLSGDVSEILGLSLENIEISTWDMHRENYFIGGERISVPKP